MVCTEVNVIAPCEMKMSAQTSNSTTNTIEGLLDIQGKFGAGTYFTQNPFINLTFDNAYTFTHMQFKIVAELYNAIERLRNTVVSYKLNESDQWTQVTTLTQILGDFQMNTFTFSEPITAKYWRFSKDGNGEVVFGMLRLFGYAPFKEIKTKTGFVLSEQDELALGEPSYKGDHVNVIAPLAISGSAKSSWADSTLEGLLDDAGSYGYGSTNTTNTHFILSYDQVYLFKYMEYLTHKRFGESRQGDYVKNVTIMYRAKEYDSWTTLTTIEPNSYKPHPNVNRIDLGEGIKAKQIKFQRLTGSDEIIFGMLRTVGLATYKEIKTKSGAIIPPITPLDGAQEVVEVEEEQVESNVVAPISLKISSTSNIGDNTVAGLLEESADCGAAAYHGMNPFIDAIFESPQVFTKVEIKCHLCYNGENRLNGTELSYKLNDSDQWTPAVTITNVKADHFIHTYEFGKGIKAKNWRFSKSGMGEIAIGMARFYAVAPFTAIKTKKGEVYSKEALAALCKPAFSGPDVNVIAPVSITGSKTDSWADNTIEGLLDENGNYGYCTQTITDANIILNFDAPYYVKSIDYLTHTRFGESRQIDYLDDVEVFYKAREFDGWKSIAILTKPKPNRQLNSLSFGEQGIIAKNLKFARRSGTTAVIFGMLRVNALAPYRDIKTKTGLVKPLAKPEAPAQPTVSTTPVVVQQPVVATSTPVVQQPVVVTPVVQQPVVATTTPVVSQPVVSVQPTVEVYTGSEINAIEPASLKFSSTSNNGDNTVAGLLDESAICGACAYYGMNPFIDVTFDKPHIFKYLEIKTHHKVYDSHIKLNNTEVSYKLTASDQWTNVSILNGLKGDHEINVITLNDVKAQYWRFSKGGMGEVVLGMVRFYGLAPFTEIKTKNGTIMSKEQILAMSKPSYTGTEINVIAPVSISGTNTDRMTDNTIEGLLDDSADYGYSTSRATANHLILNFDAVHVFKYIDFMAFSKCGESMQKNYLDQVEISYKIREFGQWTTLTSIKDVKINRAKNTIQLPENGITARYWKFGRSGSNTESIAFGMLRMYGLAPYVAHKTKTGVILTREAEMALNGPQYTGTEVNIVAPVSFKSTTLDDSLDNTIEGLLDESGLFGMGSMNQGQPHLTFDFGQIYKFKYMEFMAHQKYGFDLGCTYLENLDVSYKLKENDAWIPLTQMKNVAKSGGHNIIMLDGINARFWKFDRMTGSVVFGMLRMFAYAAYSPLKTKSGVIGTKSEREAPFSSNYQGSEINVVPIKEIISSKTNEVFAENTITGMLDRSGSFGYCAMEHDYGFNPTNIEIHYEKIHIFKRVEFLTHSLYDISLQTMNMQNVKLYYKAYQHDPWVLLTTLNQVLPYPNLNTLEMPQTEEHDGTVNQGVKARYWKLERADGKKIVVGMFRLLALAPYTPIETKYKSIIPQNGQEQQVDNDALINHYAKYIQQNYKDVTNDKEIITPKPIDASTLKEYSDSGSSDIRLKTPSLANRQDRDKYFLLLQRPESQQLINNEPHFDTRFTLSKVYFINSSNQPLSVSKIIVEYKDSNGNWTAMRESQAGYNDGVLVAKKDWNTGKITMVKDYDQINYIFMDTFNIEAGATLEYFVASTLPSVGQCASMHPADNYLPQCFPNPFQIRLTIVDSKEKKRELEMTYAIPYPVSPNFYTVESFTSQELNGLQGISVCMLNDTVNRRQAAAYQCMNSSRQYISLGAWGGNGFASPKRLTLQDIKYKYETQQLERVQVHSVTIQPAFQITYTLLCDKDNGYRAYDQKPVFVNNSSDDNLSNEVRSNSNGAVVDKGSSSSSGAIVVDQQSSATDHHDEQNNYSTTTTTSSFVVESVDNISNNNFNNIINSSANVNNSELLNNNFPDDTSCNNNYQNYNIKAEFPRVSTIIETKVTISTQSTSADDQQEEEHVLHDPMQESPAKPQQQQDNLQQNTSSLSPFELMMSKLETNTNQSTSKLIFKRKNAGLLGESSSSSIHPQASSSSLDNLLNPLESDGIGLTGESPGLDNDDVLDCKRSNGVLRCSSFSQDTVLDCKDDYEDQYQDHDKALAKLSEGLSDEQKRVFDMVKEGKSVLITGLAGAGKSFLMKRIIAMLKLMRKE